MYWCIYVKVSGSKFIFFKFLYVDDILITINDTGLLHETKIFHSNNFEMKDIGKENYMIGKENFKDKS